MQQDPGAAILKYQKDPAVSTMLRDFMEFLGNHFEEVLLTWYVRCYVDVAGRFSRSWSSQKKSGPQQQQDSQPLEGLRMKTKQKNSDTPKTRAIVDWTRLDAKQLPGCGVHPKKKSKCNVS
ncbi:hypothetical protein GQ600_12774 [Phytophthora cactorum]|nr:hypothetical protein GQ600_12774 [Phytophthora cactorum]